MKVGRKYPPVSASNISLYSTLYQFGTPSNVSKILNENKSWKGSHLKFPLCPLWEQDRVTTGTVRLREQTHVPLNAITFHSIMSGGFVQNIGSEIQSRMDHFSYGFPLHDFLDEPFNGSPLLVKRGSKTPSQSISSERFTDFILFSLV